MPIARFEMPDGRVARFSVPDGTTPEQAQQMMAAQMSQGEPQQPAPQEAQPMSRLEKLAKGAKDPLDGAAQLLTHVLPDSVVQAGNDANNWLADKTGLVSKIPERNVTGLVTGKKGGIDQMIADDESAYQAKRKAAGESGFDAWRTGGNIISPVNLAIPGGSATTTMGRVGVGIGVGAANGAISPVTEGNYWDQKAKQVVSGAVGGGVVPLATAGVSRIISPRASTNPQVQMLRNEGVTPTIGQTLGGRWNALEEKMQSIPIAGDFIANARRRSQETFNNAAINRTTAPIGQRIEGQGQGSIGEAGNALGDAYEAARRAIGHFQIDGQGAQELGTLRQMAGNMQPREQRVFNDAWDTLSHEVTQNGSITAEGFQRLDNHIGAQARRFSSSPDAYQQQLGDALTEMQRVINQNAMRANPQASALKSAADQGWANLVRVEGAAKAAKNTEGVFTPGQLNTAIQQADQSVRKRAVSRGTALMQDLANAGQQVIGNKVPNSFTTDRALIAGGGLGAGLVNPAIPLGLLGTGLIYTAPMQGLLTGAISRRPQSAQLVADTLRQASPRLAPASAQVGLGLLR